MERGVGEPPVFSYVLELVSGSIAVPIDLPDRTMNINSNVSQTTVFDLSVFQCNSFCP